MCRFGLFPVETIANLRCPRFGHYYSFGKNIVSVIALKQIVPALDRHPVRGAGLQPLSATGNPARPLIVDFV